MKPLFIIVLFLIVSCKPEESLDLNLPVCIENVIQDSILSKNLITIQLQKINGENHYWMNTDFRHSDGPEYILNNQCDTICGFCGECNPDECINDYKSKKWKIIWEK